MYPQHTAIAVIGVYLQLCSPSALSEKAIQSFLPCPLVAEPDCTSDNYTSVVAIADNLDHLKSACPKLVHVIEAASKVDESVLQKGAHFLPASDDLSHGRLIFSHTGPVNRDYDDVRRFTEAAKDGIKRALASGSKRILLVVAPNELYPEAVLVSVLGAYQALYVPQEALEFGIKPKADYMGLSTSDFDQAKRNVRLAVAIESGRSVARDLSGGNPTYMTPPVFANYVSDMFEDDSSVKVEVVSDQDQIAKDYPVMAATNRAVNSMSKFESRLVKLEYTGEGEINQTLMLLGKGVTFDSGGMDLKVGGVMLGMHRDKSGGAAVAGFFKTLSLLQPKGIKVLGAIPLVRNGIGPDAVTCDEVITARSGKRIRLINVDLEGRMILLDPLCEMKEKALSAINPQILTIATMTGHAPLTVGAGYTIVMDNGVSKRDDFSKTFADSGNVLGDPIEISTIRREDYDRHLTESDYEDLLQGHILSTTHVARGHQIPAAFLILSSGLDKHGIDSQQPIAYSGIDIAASERDGPEMFDLPTGAPIPALVHRFIFGRL